MKFYSRLGIYKNSTGTNKFNPTTKEAYSYDWWKYCTVHKGKVIFNHFFYSQSTSKHQSETLKELGYKYDLKLRHTRESLSNIIEALEKEIQGARYEIRELQSAIDKPRSRKSTNEKRRESIVNLENHIKDVEAVLWN